MKSKKRAYIASLVVLILAVGFIGVILNWLSSESAAQTKPYKIAIVLRSGANPEFVEMESTARNAESENGINIVVRKVNQEINPQEQIDVLHALANQNIDALIIDPVDSMALLPVVKQYQDAGVAVINLECRLDPASMMQFAMKAPPYVGIDNAQAAYEAAKYLSERITAPTNVVLLTGTNASMLSDERKHGALKAFGENKYCVANMTTTVYWDKSIAAAQVRELCDKYSKIGTYFCVDDVIAIGVADTLTELNKPPALVSGFGDLKATEAEIQKGNITVTVAPRSGKQVSAAIKLALDALKGKNVPDNTYIDYSLVDKSMLTER